MFPFDPAAILPSFADIPLSNYADGTFVEVEFTEDAFALDVGAGGAVTRRRIRNDTGMATVTLKAEAPENALLSALATADRRTGEGVGVFSCTDVLGSTEVLSPVAWIRKVPAISWQNGANVRAWIFDLTDLEITVGSSEPVGA